MDSETVKMEYEEQYMTIEEQIDRLIDRGLRIDDRDAARLMLSENSYTSFIRYYAAPFLLDAGAQNSDYQPGATLDELYALYTFNRKMRSLFLEYILIVERTLKTVIADRFAKVHGPCGYKTRENFSEKSRKEKENDETGEKNKPRVDELISRLMTETEKKYKSDVKNTPFDRYVGCTENIPIWLLVNLMSFGTIRHFYNCLYREDQEQICAEFAVDTTFMETALFIINRFRNACAHDERIYDFYTKRILKRKSEFGESCYYGVYAVTYILKIFLSSEQFLEFYTRLNECLLDLEPSIHTITIENIKTAMRFPRNEDIVIAEMGLYNDGVILSQTEFYNVIEKYILPLIPQGKLKLVSKNEEYKKCKNGLIEYDEGHKRIYFSQSNKSPYIVCTQELENFDISLLKVIKMHQKELMSNLQIVWNTKKAAALRTREQNLLFSTNTEIAYQLSICGLLCNKKTPDLMREFNAEKAEANKKQYNVKQEEKQRIRECIRKKENEIAPILALERAQRETLYCILSRMDQWALKTYEGKHMPFGVIVNKQRPNNSTFDYIDFLAQNYSATISDGLYSCVELYADGNYCQHIPSVDAGSDLYTIPYPHQGFAKACKDGKIGVLLTTEGDIILIDDQKMFCSKHNGRWTYNLFEKAIKMIKESLIGVPEEGREQAAQEIFHTLVDVSYSHGGACVAIADSEPPNVKLLRMTYPTLLDSVDRDTVEKSILQEKDEQLTKAEQETDSFRMNVLKNLVGHRDFIQLNEYLRRELIEMDGALILGANGKVYAVASIINTNGASILSGARTTAAMRLSKYGLAIKVSQDGYMKFYKNEVEVLTI